MEEVAETVVVVAVITIAEQEKKNVSFVQAQVSAENLQLLE